MGSRHVSSAGQTLRGNDGAGGVRFILLAVTVVQRNGQEPADEVVLGYARRIRSAGGYCSCRCIGVK